MSDVPALGELARLATADAAELNSAAQEYEDSADACDTPALAGFRRRRYVRAKALRAASERILQLVALATGGAEATKLIENCRVALRSIGPVYYHVEVAAQRARRGGNETAADILEHVHGRLFWMDHALGTMRERADEYDRAARSLTPERPAEEMGCRDCADENGVCPHDGHRCGEP